MTVAGGEPKRKGAGGGRRGGEKRECQGVSNWEKLRKILQHFIVFGNRNGTKMREPLGKG